jgi:hypothetical protein
MRMVNVLIFTRRRASRLRQPRATVSAAERGWDGQIEVVVPDNGSEDATPGLSAERSADCEFVLHEIGEQVACA